MSKIVVIDYGHGGADPGATYKGLREKDLTLQIGRKITAKLRKNRIKVVETRTKDQTVSLARRAQIANTAKADLFVSVHINSAATEKANGVETFSHPNSKSGAKLAKDIQDELVKSGFFKSNRGTKTANFYVLRHTKMTAALVELGFIKNPHDVSVMKNKQDQLAQSVTTGILNNLGIKGSVKPNKPVKPKPSAPKPKPQSVDIEALAKQVVKGIDNKGRRIPNGVNARAKHFDISVSDMQKVQNRVNQILSGKTSPKPQSINIESLAQQVVKGIDNNGRKIPNGVNNRAKHFGISISDMQKVQNRVNEILTGKPNVSTGIRVGNTITTNALYTTAESTKNVRSSPITGYVADIDNSRRNPIRLRNRRGGHYIGFTRKQDLR